MKNRTFHCRWTEKYCFIFVKGAAVCIIYNADISVLKEYDIKMHNKTKHKSQFSDTNIQ
jgi:hypothetical protein